MRPRVEHVEGVRQKHFVVLIGIQALSVTYATRTDVVVLEFFRRCWPNEIDAGGRERATSRGITTTYKARAHWSGGPQEEGDINQCPIG